jgi:hypothetical protein
MSVYGLFTGFTCVKNAALFDYLLDYNQYLWRIRFVLAERAAEKVDCKDQLQAAFSEANKPEADKVNIMASAYDQIAERHYPFKLWTCIYCMTIRFTLIITLGISFMLLFLSYDLFIIAYIASSFAFMWTFLNR